VKDGTVMLVPVPALTTCQAFPEGSSAPGVLAPLSARIETATSKYVLEKSPTVMFAKAS
jgi:hypothetical protein